MSEKDLAKELEKIKAELEELKAKLKATEGEGVLKQLKESSHELIVRITSLASEIGKSAMEVAELAFQVVKGATLGALEGAKEALKSRETQKEEQGK